MYDRPARFAAILFRASPLKGHGGGVRSTLLGAHRQRGRVIRLVHNLSLLVDPQRVATICVGSLLEVEECHQHRVFLTPELHADWLRYQQTRE